MKILGEVKSFGETSGYLVEIDAYEMHLIARGYAGKENRLSTGAIVEMHDRFQALAKLQGAIGEARRTPAVIEGVATGLRASWDSIERSIQEPTPPTA